MLAKPRIAPAGLSPFRMIFFGSAWYARCANESPSMTRSGRRCGELVTGAGMPPFVSIARMQRHARAPARNAPHTSDCRLGRVLHETQHGRVGSRKSSTQPTVMIKLSVQRLHNRTIAIVIAAPAGVHRRQCEAVDVRRPQAVERDEVPVSAMHAGDAVILIPARAVLGGNEMRIRLVLAGPRNDAAGIVAVPDLRRRQRAHEHESKERNHQPHGAGLRRTRSPLQPKLRWGPCKGAPAIPHANAGKCGSSAPVWHASQLNDAQSRCERATARAFLRCRLGENLISPRRERSVLQPRDLGGAQCSAWARSYARYSCCCLGSPLSKPALRTGWSSTFTCPARAMRACCRPPTIPTP